MDVISMANFQPPPPLRRRRGIAAVLALMYVALFATLAIGFYAATNTAAVVSFNEQHRDTAKLAAESGMEYARYQLAGTRIPANKPANLIFTEVYNDLATQVNGSANL